MFSSNDGNSCALTFEKLREIDPERSQWTDTEIRDATNLIYQNLQRLDSYLSFIVSYNYFAFRLSFWFRMMKTMMVFYGSNFTN